MSKGQVLSRLIWAAIAANLLAAGMIALMLESAMVREREHAWVNAENLTKVLEGSLTSYIQQIDMMLLTVGDEINREKALGGVDQKVLVATMNRQLARIPGVLGIRAAAIDGYIYATSDQVLGQGQNNFSGDRDYFRVLRDHADFGLVIEKPMMGRLSHKWIVVLARRVNNPDGTFAGIVHVAVETSRFDQMISSLNVGPHGVVAVWNTVPTTIARFPQIGENGGVLGLAPPPSPELAELIRSGRDVAAYHARSGTDQVERTYHFRKLAALPLYVIAGLADQDYLGDWYRQVYQFVALWGLVALLSALACWAIYRGWLQRSAASMEMALHVAAHTQALEEAWQRAEAALKRTEVILESVGEGIFGLDASGAVIFSNPAARRMVGTMSGGVMSQCCDDAAAAIKETLGGGLVHRNRETWFKRADGSLFPVDLTVTPVLVGESVTGAVVAFHDISNRKRSEEALRASALELRRSNAELEEFAYVASHDLRQPLRVVAGYVTLLDENYTQAFDDKAREYMAFVVNGVRRMDRLITGLLDYSRIGKQVSDVSVSLASVIDEAIANLSVLIKESGGQVSVDDDLPAVTGDQGELVRLFQNLIGNALKYRDAERLPEVRIASRVNGDDCIIDVIDNGIGIEARDFDRVFGLFQRLHREGPYEGTGIGLAACKKIVARLHGRIWLDSVMGQGSVFHVSLPLTTVLPDTTL